MGFLIWPTDLLFVSVSNLFFPFLSFPFFWIESKFISRVDFHF